MNKAYHLIIKGKVQGVCYRRSMQDKALSLNIKGWVKNLTNTNVEAIIEGEEYILEELINWCRQGSSSAIVDKIEKNEIVTKNFADFTVKF